jgi:hypothetical protein
MLISIFIALYGGPDQLMPITSGLAALFAFLMIFWNKVLGFFTRIAARIRSKQVRVPGGSPEEHARTNSRTPPLE